MPAQTSPHAAITAEELEAGAAFKAIGKEEITAEKIKKETITGAQIANVTLKESNYEATSVSQAKVGKATIPATGASEGQFGLGGGGVGRTLVANLQAKAEATYTLKHQQGSEMPNLAAYNKTKKASSTITWEVVTENEVKFTLGTTPAAKDEVLIFVMT